MAPALASVLTVDDRVRALEAEVHEALLWISSSEASDRRHARRRLDQAIEKATAVGDHAGQMIARAMTAANAAATALRMDEKGDAA